MDVFPANDSALTVRTEADRVLLTAANAVIHLTGMQAAGVAAMLTAANTRLAEAIPPELWRRYTGKCPNCGFPEGAVNGT